MTDDPYKWANVVSVGDGYVITDGRRCKFCGHRMLLWRWRWAHRRCWANYVDQAVRKVVYGNPHAPTTTKETTP